MDRGGGSTETLYVRRQAMTQITAMRGEKIYEHDLDLTGVMDYGMSMDALLTGREAIPLQTAALQLCRPLARRECRRPIQGPVGRPGVDRRGLGSARRSHRAMPTDLDT
jgi:hypothetical protein